MVPFLICLKIFVIRKTIRNLQFANRETKKYCHERTQEYASPGYLCLVKDCCQTTGRVYRDFAKLQEKLGNLGCYPDFDSADKVAVFDNLGNDAKLIAPVPGDRQQNYSHIGVFTKEAPEEQQQALWQRVGRVTEEQISGQPLWLNTAGGGVAWLHVRLDSSPKYYRYHPYKKME